MTGSFADDWPYGICFLFHVIFIKCIFIKIVVLDMKIRLANWFWLSQYCSACAASTRQSDSRKPVCWEWRQHRRRGGSPHPARPRSSSSFYTILQIQPEKYEARKQKKLHKLKVTHQEICLTLMPVVDLLSGMPWPGSCCGCGVCQIIPVIVI